jgi:hypothetical protein
VADGAARTERRFAATGALYCYRLLAQAIEPTIGLHRLWAGERALLAGAVEVARALALFPADELLGGIAGAVLRRAGHTDEALQLTAEAAAEGEPNALRAHALTLRAAGRATEAAAAFERLETLQPSPVERIEQARCWFVAGDPGRAAKLLANTDVEPDPELDGFARMCAAPRPSDPLESLDLLRRSVLGHRWLAPRHDATARSLTQIPDEPAPIQLSVEGWEPPSNRLAAALFAGQGDAVERVVYLARPVTLAFDPLAAPAEGRLWQVLEANPGVVTQAVPAPPQAVLGAVARVAAAAAEGDGLALWVAAQREAQATEGDAASLAHAMVRPPTSQSGRPEALYRWQCTAAALIACGAGPIEGPRGATLRALAHGQADWTASAAVFALTFLGRSSAEAASFCRQALIDTVQHLAKHPSEPRAEQLQVALKSLPGIPDEALVAFDAWGEAVFG